MQQFGPLLEKVARVSRDPQIAERQTLPLGLMTEGKGCQP